MRAVVQRVSHANVVVEGERIADIGRGLMVLLAAGPRDTPKDVAWMVQKIVGLRIFPDDEGKMNLDLTQIEGELLVVSQFTLYGDCRKGRRPSFIGAAQPDMAEQLVEDFVRAAQQRGIPCQTGCFGANMNVSLLNQGPVTLLIDSEKTF